MLNSTDPIPLGISRSGLLNNYINSNDSPKTRLQIAPFPKIIATLFPFVLSFGRTPFLEKRCNFRER